MEKISDNLFAGVGLKTTDIKGANATSAYLDMGTYDNATFIVVLGTWNAADTLDTCKLVQATDAGGTGVKDISGKAPTVNDPSASGEVYVLECKATDLDLANSYNFVACYVAEADATGVDEVTIIKIGHNLRKKSANIIGATARI